MANEKKWFGCFGALVLIALCISLVFNLFALIPLSLQSFQQAEWSPPVDTLEKPQYEEVLVEKGSSAKKIVQIDLTGVISSYEEGMLGVSMVEDMKLALEQAVADVNVAAIVLHINSPGGEVTASDAIYDAVRRTAETKPVVVYMGGVAASGGYYVACGGSHLIAHPTTITGSIGVIIQTLKYKELMGKIGLESIVFKSGEMKDFLNGSRDLTAKEIAYVQELVMETYERFLTVVSKARPLKKKTLRDGIADGRILTGQRALKEKLIDELGYIEAAYAKARELGEVPEAQVVQYVAGFSWMRVLGFLGEGSREAISVELASAPGIKIRPGHLYFIAEGFVSE